MVAQLPQRLKSMFFEIYLIVPLEKISKNVDFSLEANSALS